MLVRCPVLTTKFIQLIEVATMNWDLFAGG